MQKRFLTPLFLLLCFSASGQKITFDFPHFAGKAYIVSLLKGVKQDTVFRGTLDERGQSTAFVSVPAGFAGIARWSLLDGGGLDLVVGSEKHFTVRCAEAEPNDNNITYINTPENSFMYGQYLRQTDIISKAAAVNGMLQAYKPQDGMYAGVFQEKQNLESDFEKIQAETAQSPLYAARIREFSDYLTHTASRLTLTEKEMQAERRRFVLEKMSLTQLYRSGFWSDIISMFLAPAAEAANDSALIAGSRALLARAGSNGEIREALLHKLIAEYNRYGKENLLAGLGVNDWVSPGSPAPKLHLAGKTLQPRNALIIFYESGCGVCEHELNQLIGNYPILKERGTRVFSIAADRDTVTYEKNASRFPWVDKYCDFEGFAGDNFRTYNVVGTPTIFATSLDGNIIGRYAGLADYLKEVKY